MHTKLVMMGAQARRRTHLSVLATRFGLVAACMFLIGVVAPPVSGQAAAVAFTFTAVGDYGTSSDTDAVLAAIANSGAVFNLALGDLSYGSVQPESAWCDYVKARVGATFPFELIAGNHDSGLNAAEGNINNFAACLPHRVGSLTGTYAKEYYFDYPATDPIARIILISPKIDFQPGGYYSYSAGTTHYNWVRDAINAARAANIQWVIVGMHKLCLGTGAHTCEVETALMNLLISKKVDLILQAHDHTYQRSKQLAHTAGCSSIAAGAYNSNCVVDNGQDNTYWSGSGSVIVIAGMGGRSLYNISTADPENGYFVRWMGANANPTNGIVKFTISPAQLAAEFVRASGGTFSDRFVINSPDLPPNNLIVSDSFTRVLTNGWGSAEIGGTYSGTGSPAFAVNGSQGTVTVAAGQQLQAVLRGIDAQDVDVRVQIAANKSAAGAPHEVYLLARNRPGAGYYRVRVALTPSGAVTLVGQRWVAGSQGIANLGPVVTVAGLTHQAGAFIWLRAEVTGLNPTSIRVKAWAAGQAEPSGWTYVVTDSATALQLPGSVGILSRLPAASTRAPLMFNYDNYSVSVP